MPGAATRLGNEFKARCQARRYQGRDGEKELPCDWTSECKYKCVIVPQSCEMNHTSWVGGSILGSLTHCFNNPYASRALYDEGGYRSVQAWLNI